ncbi:MAG: AAA family ATPase [Candidatus Cloacimonetes bacterium]|nr:AAA family ATPase [Candidatus Cloacimonadota bacterium]
MFKRNMLIRLREWKSRETRKPLIIRGARQTGKTTAIKMFGSEYSQFLYFNLDDESDLDHFSQEFSIDQLIDSLFLVRKQRKLFSETLLFIDEIQNSAYAVKMLRYFYEKYPALNVIAAGSMLEMMTGSGQISFPVGRVEYLYLHPLTFGEYLGAAGESELLEIYHSGQIPEYAHNQFLDLYHEYALIGGMPEVVNNWVQNHDVVALNPIYGSLVSSYRDDIEKYAMNGTKHEHLRHVFDTVPYSTGKRISFARFGNSNYRTETMQAALKVLERAMLINIVYPTISKELPILPDLRKSPKIYYLDSGLQNYILNIQNNLIGIKDLSKIYQGRFIEQQAGMDFRNCNLLANTVPPFWVRQKRQSQAEVDFILQLKGIIIPVEVKSGASGRLRSLNSFMDRSENYYAVKISSEYFYETDGMCLSGKTYSIKNIPYYLIEKLNDYLPEDDNCYIEF